MKDLDRPGPATVAAWIGVFTAVSILLHLIPPHYFDGDTGYHIAVARLLGEHGILRSFPWTPFDWLADHYADREFLFHVALMPIANLDPNTASRVAGSFFGASILVTFFLILWKERVPRAGLWTLLMICASSAFIARFLSVRPHLVSIVLALIILWAAARQKKALLAVACLLYPLFYIAWHLPIVLSVIVEVSAYLSRKKIAPAIPAIVLGATVAGILVHPNFPFNLQAFWIQHFDMLVNKAWSRKGGFDIGGEFSAFSLKGLGRYVMLPGALGLFALAISWKKRTVDDLPLAVSLAAISFLLLTLLSQRFIEYLVPISVLAVALAAPRDQWRPAPSVLIVFALVHLFVFGTHPLDLVRRRANPFRDPVPHILQQMIPEGSQVVTCDWRSTGEMMLALPNRKFVVALEPVFMESRSPEIYKIWYETVRTPPKFPAPVLRNTFNGNFVMCGNEKKWQPFFDAMDTDPQAKLYGVIGYWRIYMLAPPKN